MTNQQHPITPPPELVREWLVESPKDSDFGISDYIATQAARWGADQQLETCCKWLQEDGCNVIAHKLHAFCRPKPPSLKEQALSELRQLSIDPEAGVSPTGLDTIRRALEQLDD